MRVPGNCADLHTRSRQRHGTGRVAEQIGRDCRVRDPSDATDVLLGIDRTRDPAGVASLQPTEIKRKSVREIDQGDIALIWPRAHSICRKNVSKPPRSLFRLPHFVGT